MIISSPMGDYASSYSVVYAMGNAPISLCFRPLSGIMFLHSLAPRFFEARKVMNQFPSPVGDYVSSRKCKNSFRRYEQKVSVPCRGLCFFTLLVNRLIFRTFSHCFAWQTKSQHIFSLLLLPICSPHHYLCDAAQIDLSNTLFYRQITEAHLQRLSFVMCTFNDMRRYAQPFIIPVFMFTADSGFVKNLHSCFYSGFFPKQRI